MVYFLRAACTADFPRSVVLLGLLYAFSFVGMSLICKAHVPQPTAGADRKRKERRAEKSRMERGIHLP